MQHITRIRPVPRQEVRGDTAIVSIRAQGPRALEQGSSIIGPPLCFVLHSIYAQLHDGTVEIH